MVGSVRQVFLKFYLIIQFPQNTCSYKRISKNAFIQRSAQNSYARCLAEIDYNRRLLIISWQLSSMPKTFVLLFKLKAKQKPYSWFFFRLAFDSIIILCISETNSYSKTYLKNYNIDCISQISIHNYVSPMSNEKVEVAYWLECMW